MSNTSSKRISTSFARFASSARMSFSIFTNCLPALFSDKVSSVLAINSSKTSLLFWQRSLYDSTNACSIVSSAIPLLSGQNFLPFLVLVTHCQITLLYCEPLCQLRRVSVPPQKPHSSIQLNAYLRLNFSRLPSEFNRLGLARRLKISCAFSKTSSDMIGSW